MEENLISFPVAKLAKERGFDLECLHFYTRPNSKMFGIDEHGRTYSIKNISKKLYKCGEHAALNIKRVYFAPTQSLLQRWLRDVHNIDIVIIPERYRTGINYCIQAQKFDLINGDITLNFVTDGSYWFNDNGEYKTYEEALEEGLKQALTLIK